MKPNGCCGLHKVTAFPLGKTESRSISQCPDRLKWPQIGVKAFIYMYCFSPVTKKEIYPLSLCSHEPFPCGYVINYKTCSLPTHSSPCPFAPFDFASTFISLYSCTLSNFYSLSLFLCLSCSHLISPSHFVCVSPFKISSLLFPVLLFSWSVATCLLLLFISGFLSLSLTLTSLWVLHR